MKKIYEVLVMFKSTATDEEIAKQIKHAEDMVKKVGGELASSKMLGRRKLSYRIGKQVEGYYQLLEFLLSTDKLDELKRQLRLDEDIVRFLVLGIDKLSSAQAESVPSAHVAAAH
jgi:small subunit ribosomal protein S6